MKKLNILWVTDNKTTVINMLTPYAINSKTRGWWSEISVIIWGASARLIATDTQVQTEVLEMINQGVKVEACKNCSDEFGVTDDLVKLGVSVRYMGETLTDHIKKGETILTI